MAGASRFTGHPSRATGRMSVTAGRRRRARPIWCCAARTHPSLGARCRVSRPRSASGSLSVVACRRRPSARARQPMLARGASASPDTARHEAVFWDIHLHIRKLSVRLSGLPGAPVASKYWADQGARSDWAGVARTTCGPQSFWGAPTPAAARFTGRHMGSGRANEVRGVAIHIDPEPLSIRAWPSGRARQSIG